MKSSFFWRLLTSSAIALGITTAINPPTVAGGNTYYCAQLNGVYKTFVSTTRGRIALINWVNSYSEQWTAQNRCLEVSQRFQRFLENGTLKYIRTGVINNQPVICVANQRGGVCPNNQILVTLPPDRDSEEVLVSIFDTNRSLDTGNVTLTDDVISYTEGETYINVSDFLNTLPIEEEE